MSDPRLTDGHECADEDGEQIPVCPECDSPTIGPRVRGESSRAPEYEWRCRDCHAGFDDARWRRRKRDWTTSTPETMLRRAGVENPEAVIDYGADGSGGQADE